MKRNMERTFGLIYSRPGHAEADRQGHEPRAGLRHGAAARDAGLGGAAPFRPLVEADEVISEMLDAEEIDDCFDYRYHLKHVDTSAPPAGPVGRVIGPAKPVERSRKT